MVLLRVMAWWLASPCSKVVSFSKSQACTENYISSLRFGQSCQFGFFRNQGRACLTHVYWPLTEEDQGRVGHFLIRQKTFFLSQLVSKRGSSFPLKIKKGKEMTCFKSVFDIDIIWMSHKIFFLLTFIPFASAWYLDANSEEKRKRKIFFPL